MPVHNYGDSRVLVTNIEDAGGGGGGLTAGQLVALDMQIDRILPGTAPADADGVIARLVAANDALQDAILGDENIEFELPPGVDLSIGFSTLVGAFASASGPMRLAVARLSVAGGEVPETLLGFSEELGAAIGRMDENSGWSSGDYRSLLAGAAGDLHNAFGWTNRELTHEATLAAAITRLIGEGDDLGVLIEGADRMPVLLGPDMMSGVGAMQALFTGIDNLAGTAAPTTSVAAGDNGTMPSETPDPTSALYKLNASGMMLNALNTDLGATLNPTDTATSTEDGAVAQTDDLARQVLAQITALRTHALAAGIADADTMSLSDLVAAIDAALDAP